MIGKLYILSEKIRLNMRMIKYRFLKRVWKKKRKGNKRESSNKIFLWKMFSILKKKEKAKILKISILELLFKFCGILAHTNILNNFIDKYNYSIELTLFLKNMYNKYFRIFQPF